MSLILTSLILISLILMTLLWCLFPRIRLSIVGVTSHPDNWLFWSFWWPLFWCPLFCYPNSVVLYLMILILTTLFWCSSIWVITKFIVRPQLINPLNLFTLQQLYLTPHINFIIILIITLLQFRSAIKGLPLVRSLVLSDVKLLL